MVLTLKPKQLTSATEVAQPEKPAAPKGWGANTKVPKQADLPTIAVNSQTLAKTDISVASEATIRTVTAPVRYESKANPSTGPNVDYYNTSEAPHPVRASDARGGDGYSVRSTMRRLSVIRPSNARAGDSSSIRSTATRNNSTRAEMAKGMMFTPRGVLITGENLRQKVNLKPGDIINLPTHEAEPYHDDAPKGTKDSGASMLTRENGWVYSKRRFAIVLWAFEEEFFVVPTYTFGGKGLLNKQAWEKMDYICVQRTKCTHVPQNDHASLAIKHNPSRPDTTWSYAHLLGGLKVSYKEDYVITDQVDASSYDTLTKLWFTKNIGAYAAGRALYGLPALPNLTNFAYVDPKSAYTKPATITPSKWNGSLARGSVIGGNVR